MSDTKGLNNQIDTLNGRLDHVERARVVLEDKLKAARQQTDTVRADANHWRREARELAGQIGRIGAGLSDLHALAVSESEKNPGETRLASRVQATRAAVSIFTTVTEGLVVVEEHANG